MESHDELLEHARNVLKRARRHPDPAALVKMRSAIDEALVTPERSPIGFRWFAAAGAALAACAALVAVMSAEEGPRVKVIAGQAIRSERSYALSQGAVLDIGRARVRAVRDTQIELPSLRAEAVHVDLFEGEVELDVDPAQETLLVSTPLAEIRVIGTRFSVTAEEDRTEVVVSKGEVEVRERASGRIARVGAGQRHAVERARPSRLSGRDPRPVPRWPVASASPAAEAQPALEAHREDGVTDRDPAQAALEAHREDGTKVRPLPHPRRPVMRRPKPRRDTGDRARPGDGASVGDARESGDRAAARRDGASVLDREADRSAVTRDGDRAAAGRDGDAVAPGAPKTNVPGDPAMSPGSPKSDAASAPLDATPAIPPSAPKSGATQAIPPPAPKVDRPPATPPPAIEPIEMLVHRADRARRAGKAKDAALLYAAIAEHPDGGPFAEEALFRKAELSRRLGQPQAALQALADAERRFGRGELAPERSALAARIHLDREDAKTAARALSGLPKERATLEVAIVALDVAGALAEDHPCEALALLPLVHDPKELRMRAEELEKRVGSRCRKSP